jgi:hypothetical protein
MDRENKHAKLGALNGMLRRNMYCLGSKTYDLRFCVVDK